MKKLSEAKKYNCILKFTIDRCGGGWTHMICDFNGQVLNFSISTIGDQPTALLEIAYLLNASFDNNTGFLHIDVDEDEYVTDQEGNANWICNLGGSFQWDEEPRLNDWHIRMDPKDFGKEDFNLTISINRSTGLGEERYSFVVSYRDYCYAVAKCFTNVLKRYGFYEHDTRTYTDQVVVRHLLVSKAYALGLLGNRISTDSSICDSFELNFEDELRLLVIDM